MARSRRNDFLAGMFILAALAALAVVLVLIHDWETYQQVPQSYFVEFPQVAGLKVNSPVLLGGWPVGSVRSVERQWRKDEQTGVETFAYVVALEIPRDIALRRDAEIGIETKLIGEGAAVNIVNVGSGEPAEGTEGRPIPGRSGTAMMNAAEALGIGDEEREQIARTIADIKALTADLRETAPKISRAVTNVEELTTDLRQRLPGILESVGDGAKTLKTSAERIDGILEENRDKLKSSVANVEEMTASAKGNVDLILGNLGTTSNDIRGLVAANRMNLTDTMVNLRETSEHLKAASEEIRRAPWRLLYKPDKREADTLNIYDASRSYAAAAADLHSTTLTLESLMALQKEGIPVDEKALRDMLERVRASLDRYGEAESALWQQWGSASGK